MCTVVRFTLQKELVLGCEINGEWSPFGPPYKGGHGTGNREEPARKKGGLRVGGGRAKWTIALVSENNEHQPEQQKRLGPRMRKGGSPVIWGGGGEWGRSRGRSACMFAARGKNQGVVLFLGKNSPSLQKKPQGKASQGPAALRWRKDRLDATFQRATSKVGIPWEPNTAF